MVHLLDWLWERGKGGEGPPRLSSVDEAWLRMDRPDNRMVITAVMVTATPLTCSAVRELIGRRMLHYPRFRRALVGTGAASGDSGEPLLEAHVQPAELPAPGDEAALRTWVGALMERPLAPTRPLWELYVVERYGAGSALVWRLHHALADGVSLMRALLGAVDEPAPAGSPDLPLPRRLGLEGLRLAAGAVASVGRLVLMTRDRPSRLKGALSGHKRVAWSRPVPVETVKRIGKREGATVNDVLVAALAGALREHLVRYGRVPHTVRAVVPFDLRSGAADVALGNRFGLLFLPLPTGTADPHQRLARVKREMDAKKLTPEGIVVFALLGLVGWLSPVLSGAIIHLFARKATLVLTNVAGPRQHVSLGGARVDDFVFWVPQAGGLGLGISILSYAGQVRIGIASDADRVAAPEHLAEAFVRELEDLAGG